MGLSVSDAIRLLLMRVADEKRLPFAIQVPNATTVNAMKELEADKGKRFSSDEDCSRIKEIKTPKEKPARSGAFLPGFDPGLG